MDVCMYRYNVMDTWMCAYIEREREREREMVTG